jgi:hypothetical protein
MRVNPHVLVLLLAIAAPLVAQRPAESDIFLAPLTVNAGHIEVGKPVNVTNRPGYNNQPVFTPDSRTMLYTSIRDDAQADIYAYDIPARAIIQITKTPESEYSANMMPGGQRFSVIRVELDSTQRLWSFRLDGSDPQLVVTGIKPVGYHAWADSTHVALFVVGAGRIPATLQLADVRTGHVDTLARNIGRSLLPIPEGHGFSFVQYGMDTTLMVVRLDPRSGVPSAAQALVKMPFRTDYVAWLRPSLLLAAKGNTLVTWDGSSPDWKQVADLSSTVTGITRLAVSPDGKWLALVATGVK